MLIGPVSALYLLSRGLSLGGIAYLKGLQALIILLVDAPFGYFADRYGFTIVGAVIPSVSSGASPSAQQMAQLVEHIKATGAPAIFLETGSNPQLARQLAQEAGVKAVTELYTHSITESDGPAPTYLEMMKYNVKTIVEGLK